jgi:O-acetyl-ADP-ribose deacetylase (regulator of RNase III)
MILYVKGSLFHSPAQVLVNTVNTVGVMGKGVALEFKRLFPEMYNEYHALCENNKFKVGMLWLYKSPNKWVLNFPTKKHWRNPSRVEYIEDGLKKFVSTYEQMGIQSIAFPPLGCGNGQLDFEIQVQPLMEKYLRRLPIEVFIYPDKKSDFVEHLNPKLMKQWLRSDPTALPFTEVWDDLRELLDTTNEFHTIVKNTPFTARIDHEAPGIEVFASGQKYHIPYEILQAFWQQIRIHGFSTRNIAPGIDRQMSYLAPIFAQLEYVTPVHVADEFSNLQNAMTTGLQILPSAFSRKKTNSLQPIQLSLLQL